MHTLLTLPFNSRFFGADRHSRRGGRGEEWSGDACVAHGGQGRSSRGTGRRATQGSPPFLPATPAPTRRTRFPARFTKYLPLRGRPRRGKFPILWVVGVRRVWRSLHWLKPSPAGLECDPNERELDTLRGALDSFHDTSSSVECEATCGSSSS